jgi:hypothetical protein
MEKINWTNRAKYAVLQRVTEERNILPTIKRRNALGLVWFCIVTAL